MAIDLKKTDVVIVGLGAVGGVAALPLARAGLDVIGIEAGTWLSPRDFAPDELRNNFRGWPQSAQKANGEIPTHRPNASAPYSPRLPIHPMMNAVGGTSLHYWAQSWRLNPWDFRVVSETTRRYGAARIPKGSTVEDWPFGLEELEPFYDKVEYEVGVSGQAGNVGGTIDKRGNIFEGARARAYPMPALTGTEFTEHMATTARGLGWHPFPGPAAINSQTYDDRPGCLYHGFCNRGGCHVNAKNSTAVSTIPKAVATGRLGVVTQAIVTSVAVDEGSGRVRGVVYLKGGEEYFQPADVVLLAGYTYENVRMLLLSKSKPFPNGLANNGGQVGRHYFSHHTGATLTALFPFDLNNWYGLPAQGVAVDNWADDNFDHSGLDFIGGGNLWVYSDRRPISAAIMSTFGQSPTWGTKLEGVHQGERRPLEHRLPAEDHAAVRGQRARPRPRGEGCARLPGDPHHRRQQGQREEDRRLHPGQDGAVVHGGGREDGGARAARHHGPLDPCLWRHPHGRQPRDQRGQPLRLRARGAEPRHPRRLRHGHQRRPQPDPDRAGAGLAHRRASAAQLEHDRELIRATRRG